MERNPACSLSFALFEEFAPALWFGFWRSLHDAHLGNVWVSKLREELSGFLKESVEFASKNWDECSEFEIERRGQIGICATVGEGCDRGLVRVEWYRTF
jgi:hypothetical protein